MVCSMIIKLLNVKNLLFICLLFIAILSSAEELKFECQVKVTGNLPPPLERIEDDKKMQHRDFTYDTDRKVISNWYPNSDTQFTCTEQEMNTKITCKGNHKPSVLLEVNKITFRVLYQDGGPNVFDTYIRNEGSCVLVDKANQI